MEGVILFVLDHDKSAHICFWTFHERHYINNFFWLFILKTIFFLDIISRLTLTDHWSIYSLKKSSLKLNWNPTQQQASIIVKPNQNQTSNESKTSKIHTTYLLTLEHMHCTSQQTTQKK